ERLMKSTLIPFNSEVPGILIAGALNRPRKIVQFVNNLVILAKLAQAKEMANIISRGSITQNVPFLTKMLVLREEYPEFYKRLERDEYLLEYTERYLRGDR